MSAARVAAALRRILGLIRAPADEWTAIAANLPGSAAILVGHVLPLAAIPAVAWEVGLAVFGLDAFEGGLPPAQVERSFLVGAATTLLGSLITVSTFALALYAIAPFYEAPRSWARAWATAAYGATPVWLAGALLVQPVLILAVVITTLQACYLWFLGVQSVLRVRPGAAAECVAIALLLGTMLTMLAGGLLGGAGLL